MTYKLYTDLVTTTLVCQDCDFVEELQTSCEQTIEEAVIAHSKDNKHTVKVDVQEMYTWENE